LQANKIADNRFTAFIISQLPFFVNPDAKIQTSEYIRNIYRYFLSNKNILINIKGHPGGVLWHRYSLLCKYIFRRP